MKRRFNYTGRKRISREKINIVLNKDNKGKILSFSVDINLNGEGFYGEPKILIEAYHRTEHKIFDFGNAADGAVARDLSLKELPYTDNLKFRVLVVDSEERILADADGITPEQEAEEKPILPVEFRDIGRQVWKVEFVADEGAPVLVLNSNIPNIENHARSPQLIMDVYPAVIREVLKHMVFVEGIESPAEPSVSWHADWLEFSNILCPFLQIPDYLDPRNDSFNADDVLEWIEGIVNEFCHGRKEWAQYIQQITGEET